MTVLLDPAHQPADDPATIAELAAAVRGCAARVVLVSPEVGLSLVPTTPLGRAFTDALGATNRAVADACDAVVLVVAGQPVWLKPAARAAAAAVPAQAGPADRRPGDRGTRAGRRGRPEPSSPAAGVATAARRAGAARAVAGRRRTRRPADRDWAAPTDGAADGRHRAWSSSPAWNCRCPTTYAGPQAVDRLATLDVPGAGLGVLERVVGFAAATQGTSTPAPWTFGAGAAAARRPRRRGVGRRTTRRVGAPGPRRRAPARARWPGWPPRAAPASRWWRRRPPRAMEDGPALTAEAGRVGAAATAGGWPSRPPTRAYSCWCWRPCGAGTEAAAAAVLAATAGAEPPAVLGRVLTEPGEIDDAAWMVRCAAVRDALHRTRRSPRGAKDVLAELGGGDIAVATGVLLGATARRMPVLLDGPVGVAAGLVSRDLAGQARHWCLLRRPRRSPGGAARRRRARPDPAARPAAGPRRGRERAGRAAAAALGAGAGRRAAGAPVAGRRRRPGTSRPTAGARTRPTTAPDADDDDAEPGADHASPDVTPSRTSPSRSRPGRARPAPSRTRQPASPGRRAG